MSWETSSIDILSAHNFGTARQFSPHVDQELFVVFSLICRDQSVAPSLKAPLVLEDVTLVLPPEEFDELRARGSAARQFLVQLDGGLLCN